MYKEFNTSQSQSSYDFPQLLNDLKAVEESLTRHGLRVSGAGRFPEYRRCIERAASHRESHVGVRDEDRAVLFRAMIEIHELDLIVKVLGGGNEVPGWKEKTQTTLSGTVTAGAQDHDHARNIQFELYLAAVARRSGFEVRLEEPDVLCLDEEWGMIAIAAKRVQSERKIKSHLRKANSQLKKAGTPGIAALDLTWAVPRFAAARQGLSNESIGQTLHNDVRTYVEDHADSYHDQIDPSWTYAILVHVVSPCVINNSGPGRERSLGRNRVLRWLNFRELTSPEGASVLSFKERLRWED